MIRFFCQLCNKVKRVRRAPTGYDPLTRELVAFQDGSKRTFASGECRWHRRGTQSLRQFLVHATKFHINTKRKSSSILVSPSKPKGQGKSIAMQEARRRSA